MQTYVTVVNSCSGVALCDEPVVPIFKKLQLIIDDNESLGGELPQNAKLDYYGVLVNVN